MGNLVRKVDVPLNNLDVWLKVNKLLLNLGNTKLVQFSADGSSSPVDKFSADVPFLGVQINDKVDSPYRSVC